MADRSFFEPLFINKDANKPFSIGGAVDNVKKSFEPLFTPINQSRPLANDSIFKPFQQSSQAITQKGKEIAPKLLTNLTKIGNKTLDVLNPGSTYIQPALEKRNIPFAPVIGLGIDILSPGPGEFGKAKKVTEAAGKKLGALNPQNILKLFEENRSFINSNASKNRDITKMGELFGVIDDIKAGNTTMDNLRSASELMKYHGVDIGKPNELSIGINKGKIPQSRNLLDMNEIGVPINKNIRKVPVQEKSFEDKNLLVVHNLTEKKLHFADRIGGLANPSTAVINPKLNAFESYGDISLIGNKELIRGQKTHLSDGYTARFPSVHTSMNYDDFGKLEKELEPYYKKIGDDARKVYHDDTEMIRNIENNPAVVLKFLEENGIKPSKDGQHYFHQQIAKNGLDQDFQAYLNDIYERFNLKEQMFDGYTAMGRRRYKPVSLSEASKIMGKQKEEGFNYGLGSYRSKIAPVKTSPEAIKKEAGRLVNKEDFEKIKDSYDKELFDLKDELEPFAKHKDSNQFTEGDHQLNAIGAILEGQKDGMYWFKNKFGDDVPEELVSKVFAFRDKLKNMPTEYFETKFKRPVGLEEFNLAVVPDTISKKTEELLNKKGLQVIKYPKGGKDKIMKDLLKRPEAFGIGVIPFAQDSKQDNNKRELNYGN